MTDLERLFKEFTDEWAANGSADPERYLERVDGAERQELASRMDSYLMEAPSRRWDPVAYESSPAKQAVERAYESIEGVSGTWPELLPELRNRARVRRRELVERLAGALGFSDEAQVEKVAAYYHGMEHGQVAASGVSGRVTDALAGIVGASAEAIRKAGAAVSEGAGIDSPGEAGAGPAYARVASEDPLFPVEVADMDQQLAARVEPEPLDEVDELFLGG